MKVTVITANGSTWTGTSFSSPTRYVGWRCLHQAEGGYPNPDKMPIVRPSFDAPPVLFSSPLQWLDFKINRFNPLYTGQRWRSTNHSGIAFCNNQGFEEPGDPRVDYINRQDLDKPLPKRMKAIVCGGNFFTGSVGYNLKTGIQQAVSFVRQGIKFSLAKTVVADNILTMYPGVDGIDANRPWSNIDAWATDVLAKHWYFHATTRNGDKINNFPQGQGKPVYVAYFLYQPVSYPLSWFEPWNETYLPDPLVIYR